MAPQAATPIRSRCERACRASCHFAMLAGLAVITGWIGGIEMLKRGLPGMTAMNPVTAACFVVVAATLGWLSTHRTDATHGHRSAGAKATALIVLAVALIELGSYKFGWFASGLRFGVEANQMAPNTALNICLMALALFALDVDGAKGWRPAELAAGAVALISLLALIGYAYNVQSLYTVPGYISMAPSTAIVSLALAFGILCARPERGFMGLATDDGIAGLLLRRLLPVIVLTLVVLGWLRLAGEQQGLYKTEQGVAYYTLANIVIFGALLAWSAYALRRVEVERDRIREQQRQSDERVRLLLDSTGEAIYGIDEAGLCTFNNRACTRMLGLAGTDSLLGRDMHALIHSTREDGTPFPLEECRICRPLRQQSEVHVDDEFVRRADGTGFPAECWSSPIVRQGQRVGAVITLLDITARRLAEDRLRQSQKELSNFFSLSIDLLCISSGDGYFKRTSPGFTSALGWSVEEMLTTPFIEMVHPDDRASTLAEVDRQLVAGHPVMQFENRYRHRDGSWRILSWRSMPYDGLMYATARDVTESRQAEAQIQALNEELRASNELLKSTNRELESFTYSVSHDLRAPLRHVDGFARMLAEDAGDTLDPSLRRYIDAISESARRMGTLIDDLLAFSRLGRKPLECTETDMGHLANRALADIGDAHGPRSAVHFDEALPAAVVDPVLMRQVWVNLLSNALKYTSRRGADARVQVSGERDGDMARYRVQDNGVGFDMRYADKLFGVFQRLHTQDEFAGTGVGLAIVQRIVARHGGRIQAQAEVDRGATFTFELPVVAGHREGDAA